MTAPLLLVHDVGTTSSKSVLYRLGDRLDMLETAIEDYPLYVLDNGGIEQDPDLWWTAICRGTQAVLRRAQVAPEAIQGMAFWAQVQENQDVLKWCGSSPMYTFLKAVPDARGQLLRYQQWNIDEQSVVSFAGMRFTV
ncbi:MAG: hypothetical protein J0M07_23590 [Anaerolineae bacterium]|nr:hypothetical protein [Anaerolineae bacterium]